MEQLHDSALETVDGSSSSSSLSTLADQLRTASRELELPERRDGAATKVNGVLAAIVAKGVEAEHRATVAKAILEVLEERHFKLATDANGLSCRSQAVAAVIALGYPWALQLHPDDLAFYREKSKPSRTGRWAALAIALAMAAGGLGAAWYWLSMPVLLVPEASGPSGEFTRTPDGAFLKLPDGRQFEVILATDAASRTPDIQAAESALMSRNDPTGALRAVDHCLAGNPIAHSLAPNASSRAQPDDACTTLKVIALALRNHDTDQAVAISTFDALKKRSPSYRSVPGLEQLLTQKSHKPLN